MEDSKFIDDYFKVFFLKNHLGSTMFVYGTQSYDDAPSVVLFEKHLFAASFLVLIFSKKAGFSLTKVNKVAVPRPLSFLESTSSQASFLVLIFSKKVGFSLAKVKKVATKRILSDPAKFFSCRIKRHLFGKQIALIQMKKQHNTYNKYY